MNIQKLKDTKFIIKKGMQNEGDPNIGGIVMNLEAEGFDLIVNCGDVIGIRYNYKTFHQSAIDALNEIAKYVEKGAYLEFTKDDGESFKLILEDGKFCENKKMNIEKINKILSEKDCNKISDGYHTFEELYYDRMYLFSIICNNNKTSAWKSKKHDDGKMFDDFFIVGITTYQGDFTYHYHLKYWELFEVSEVEFAPPWDGHTRSDISRLKNVEKGRCNFCCEELL